MRKYLEFIDYKDGFTYSGDNSLEGLKVLEKLLIETKSLSGKEVKALQDLMGAFYSISLAEFNAKLQGVLDRDVELLFVLDNPDVEKKMNLNQFDFVNLSLSELSHIGAIIRDEEEFTNRALNDLESYINRYLIEKNDKISRKVRIRLIKKILFSIGASYPEFNAIYSRLDQELESRLDGD